MVFDSLKGAGLKGLKGQLSPWLLWFAAALLVSGQQTACGSDVCGDASEAAVGEITYTGHARQFLETHCVRCHAQNKFDTDRKGAPVSVSFDTYEGAVDFGPRMAARVELEQMPDDAPETVPQADRCLLTGWVEQGLRL